jgi:hypothetical protein
MEALSLGEGRLRALFAAGPGNAGTRIVAEVPLR